MRQEAYRIKCPKHILVGDPLYFEEYANNKKRLSELVVDYKPSPGFHAGISLVETEYPDFPEYIARTITIYLAPERDLKVYMDGKMYASQKIKQKEIGVDTACYTIEVDGRYEDIRTGGDGYWGDYQEFYREAGKRRCVDAVIISIAMPDHETFKGMQRMTKYFFEDLKPMEKQKKPNKAKGQDR